MNVLVKINDLSKEFEGVKALENLTLDISQGQLVALAGPDGAGKTTLLRLIASLLLPTTGSIQVDGIDTVKNPEEIRSLISYMPQKFGLYDDISVIQNLRLYADLQLIDKEKKEETIEELLEFTKLSPFKTRLTGALSGGMKNKLSLACTLVRKPKLLLLDEPSVGLDPISRHELWAMVDSLIKEGMTILWSTTYLEEAEQCAHTLLLNHGKVLYNGLASDLVGKLKGRTFDIRGEFQNPWEILKKIHMDDNIIDSAIHGSRFHLVLKDPTQKIDLDKFGLSGARIEESTPSIDDAFIEMIGEKISPESLLAEHYSEFSKTHEEVIKAENLTKMYGNFTAVNKLNLSIKRGEIFGLLGPNGAGKSTTFKMLCGLTSHTEGSTFVNGVDMLKSPSKARAHIGYMAQKFSLYGDLTVLQNLNFFAGAYNLKGNEKRQAIEDVIKIFDLKELINTPASKIPLGFKQRLALACAVMHKPDILFLDEPGSGVDPIVKREFWNHMYGLASKGVTILVTTHFLDQAELCDRVALIYQGNLIEMGSPKELKEKAKTKENGSPSLEEAFIHNINKYDDANKESEKL